jgi:hypothetical protein
MLYVQRPKGHWWPFDSCTLKDFRGNIDVMLSCQRLRFCQLHVVYSIAIVSSRGAHVHPAKKWSMTPQWWWWWWSRVKLHLFSSLSSLPWWHKYVSPFAMSAFSNAKTKRSRADLALKSHWDCLSIGHSLARSPLWHLGHYSNFFNWKSNVIVTQSEHVDGIFQARCGQRLQSTNHVVLRATISPRLVRREA